MRFAAVVAAAGMLLQTQVRLAPEPVFFRFVRTVSVDPGNPSVACAVLDRALYADARPSLPDLRLMARGVTGLHEVPYALTISSTAATNDSARVLNLSLRGGKIVFDLEMPHRPYSEVQLNLKGENFLATAEVTGLHALAETRRVRTTGVALGTFTLFDLSGQGLSRNTTLPLVESTFPYLHVVIATRATPDTPILLDPASVLGAQVPASRMAQTVYTTLWQTSEIVQQGHTSVATFVVPAHVPVERVSFDLAPGDRANFRRTVQVEALAINGNKPQPEVYPGEIAQLHINEGATEIRESRLSVPAIVGSNAQSGAVIRVRVENGESPPLALQSVRLEMRERKLCFEVPSEPLALYFGDAKLEAPAYDYARLFRPADRTRTAHLGAAMPNPRFVPSLHHVPGKEQDRALLWAVAFSVVSTLIAFALRSGRRG